MRILIVGVSYYPAIHGQAVFTVNLAEGLAQRGHDVCAVFPIHAHKAVLKKRNRVRLEGLPRLSLGFIHPDANISVGSAPKIRRILDEFQPDMVHIQDHYPLARATVKAATSRGLKVVATNHFMPANLAPYLPMYTRGKAIYEWLLWRWMLETYNRAAVVTAQSRVAAEIVRGQGLRPPIFPVSCGLDLTRFRPLGGIDRAACRARYGLDPEHTLFLYVGRLDGEKRLDVLLHAMQMLDRDDVQLAIAGEGAASKRLHALAESLRLGDRVRFIGFVANQDLPILLNSADIFTMPSEAELLSIATLEAMACGRPVLLANAFALSDLVAEGINGCSFRPGDPTDAAHKMDLLASRPDCWPAMGQASAEKAQVHGLDRTIRRYEALYEAVLAGKPFPDRQS